MESWEDREDRVLFTVPRITSPEGEYNKPPEGLKEITETGFSHSAFFVYGPAAIEYRQFEWKGFPITLYMFWMDKTSGYGMSRDHRAGRVLYYHFGCEHEFRTETIGRCLHKWTCKKCGFERTVDSSD